MSQVFKITALQKSFVKSDQYSVSQCKSCHVLFILKIISANTILSQGFEDVYMTRKVWILSIDSKSATISPHNHLLNPRVARQESAWKGSEEEKI